VTKLARDHGSESKPFPLFVLARLASLGEHFAVAPSRVVEWAKLASEQMRAPWSFHVLGLAYLRAQDFEAAKQAIDRSKQVSWSAGALDDLADCLLLHRMGKTAEARDLFVRANSSLERPPETVETLRGLPLTDWLEYQVLRPQLERLQFDSSWPADPFAH
jgi:hypothetical protein